MTGEIDPFSGSTDGRMNYPFMDFLWGTDPEEARFYPLSRFYSFTTQPGPVTLVLVSHHCFRVGSAGSKDQSTRNGFGGSLLLSEGVGLMLAAPRAALLLG